MTARTSKLIQTIFRIVIGIIVILMLFLPWCNIKFSLSSANVTYIRALTEIAYINGSISDADYRQLYQELSWHASETQLIEDGKYPNFDDPNAPQDLFYDLRTFSYISFPGSSLSSILQNEIGTPSFKLTYSTSPVGMLTNLVNCFRNSTIAGASPYINMSEPTLAISRGLDASEISRYDRIYGENIQKCKDINPSLLSHFQSMGINNSASLVTLCELQNATPSIQDIRMTMLLCTSFKSGNLLLSRLVAIAFLIIAPLVIFARAFSLIIKSLKKNKKQDNDDSYASINDHAPFSLLFTIIAFTLIPFIYPDSTLAVGFFVSVAIIVIYALVCHLFRTPSDIRKTGRIGKSYKWMLRVVSIVCIAASVLTLVMFINLDVMSSRYTLSLYNKEQIEAKNDYADDLAEEEMKLNNATSDDQRYKIIKNISAIEDKIEQEPKGDLLFNIDCYKFIVAIVYMLIVASYIPQALKRFAFMDEDYSVGYIPLFYIRFIVAVILGAILSSFLLGAVTPVLWGMLALIFAIEVALKVVGFLIYKKSIFSLNEKITTLTNNGLIAEGEVKTLSYEFSMTLALLPGAFPSVADLTELALDDFQKGLISKEQMLDDIDKVTNFETKSSKLSKKKKATESVTPTTTPTSNVSTPTFSFDFGQPTNTQNNNTSNNNNNNNDNDNTPLYF